MREQATRPQRPLPNYNSPYQPGISDPQWPIQIPPYLKDKGGIARYAADQAGRPDAQDWLVAIFLDVKVRDRQELCDLLKDLSRFARDEMKSAPGKSELEVWNPAPPRDASPSRLVLDILSSYRASAMTALASATKSLNGSARCRQRRISTLSTPRMTPPTSS